MWVIAGIIIADLFYVFVLRARQRPSPCVSKALGSSSAVLLGSPAMQAVLVALWAAAFGMADLELHGGGVFEQTVDILGSAWIDGRRSSPSWWDCCRVWWPCARPAVPIPQRRSQAE